MKVEPLAIDATVQGVRLEGPSVYGQQNSFVWGATVIEDRSCGKEHGKGNPRYHMFYSTWACSETDLPFTDAWVLHSKIGYATSDYPDREFTFQKIVLQGRALDGYPDMWDSQVVTNPHIQRFNGKYYLYYIGSVDPGEAPKGSKGEGVRLRDRVQQNMTIGVVVFHSFEDLLAGRITRFDSPLVTPRTRVKADYIINPSPQGTQPKPDNIIMVNPSVVQRPWDGKYLLYFKGNIYEPHWKGVHGVAIGDSPSGPFVPMDSVVFDIKMEDGSFASCEDPFVWFHRGNERFYAIFKDFTGRITGGEPGLALLESPDGMEWSKLKEPVSFKKELTLRGGAVKDSMEQVVPVNRLERPFLLVDNQGSPQVLYAACSLVDVNPRSDGSSFNVQIPLKVTQ